MILRMSPLQRVSITFSGTRNGYEHGSEARMVSLDKKLRRGVEIPFPGEGIVGIPNFWRL